MNRLSMDGSSARVFPYDRVQEERWSWPCTDFNRRRNPLTRPTPYWGTFPILTTYGSGILEMIVD